MASDTLHRSLDCDSGKGSTAIETVLRNVGYGLRKGDGNKGGAFLCKFLGQFLYCNEVFEFVERRDRLVIIEQTAYVSYGKGLQDGQFSVAVCIPSPDTESPLQGLQTQYSFRLLWLSEQ